jgi:two-component system NtrC family sensor kinase
MRDEHLLASSVLQALSAGIYVLDTDFNIRWLNKQSPFWSEIKTLSESNSGSRCYSLLFQKDSPCDDCPARKVFETGKTERSEMTMESAGGPLYFSLTAAPMQYDDGNVSLVVQIIDNITEKKKKIENELARINDFNTAIVENAPISICTIDKNGVFTSVNPAMLKSVDVGPDAKKKLIGFRWLENPYTIRSGLAEHIKKGLAGQPFNLKEFPFVTWGGNKNIFLDFNGFPMHNKDGKVSGIVLIVEDSTERVKMRNQIIQEAKAAVMAKLAMGVAHGINNPLATIAIHSDLASEIGRRLEQKHVATEEIQELRTYLDVIQEETFRCKKIVNSLLKFSSAKVSENEETDLKKLFDDLLGLAYFNKKNVKVERRIPEGLPVIGTNRSAIRQVFWNLLMNAFDAAENRKPARIQIRCGLLPGDLVFVDIEDNGKGIPDCNRDKIFTPFFTTKAPDKGTGLGLSLSEELVRKLGGTIELLSSKEGKGSTFRVTLRTSGESEERP